MTALSNRWKGWISTEVRLQIPKLLDFDYSGEEEVEYEMQQQQPMSLEQQKEELKRKL